MDRNALDNVSVGYDELVPILTSQIGQLNVELAASKVLIQKLQAIVEELSNSNAHNDDKKTS